MLPSKKKVTWSVRLVVYDEMTGFKGLNKYNNNHRDIANFIKFFWWQKYIVLTPNK